MSYSQSQLEGLREAAASGTTRVTYDGTTVEYRSLSEILKMIGIIERALAPQPPSHVNPTFRRTS